MRRTEAADAALEMAAGGHTAYICHDGGLRVGDSPSGRVILVIRPDHAVQREPLVALLTHRMRMKGVA